MNARLVTTRQFEKNGRWYREVKIKAEDQKNGFTAGQLIDILAQVPVDIHPKVVVRIPGQIKEIMFTVTMIPGEADAYGN